MSEVLWKPIPGFEGIYSVSTEGSVRSEARTVVKTTGPANLREKPRRSALGVDGYYRITLRRNNKSYTFLLHRLVLLAFRGSPTSKHEGCHLDGNPRNNILINLCWAAHSENEKHKINKGTSNRGSNHYLTKLTENDVYCIKTLLFEGKSQQKVANKFNVDRRVVNQISTGKTWKHVRI